MSSKHVRDRQNGTLGGAPSPLHEAGLWARVGLHMTPAERAAMAAAAERDGSGLEECYRSVPQRLDSTWTPGASAACNHAVRATACTYTVRATGWRGRLLVWLSKALRV